MEENLTVEATQSQTENQPTANQSEGQEQTLENAPQSENVQAEAKNPEPPKRETVKVKHNKAEIEVDPYSEEGNSYIRKGIDYDRIREGYDKAKPVVSLIEKLAKEDGYSSTEQYIAAVEEQRRQRKLQEISQLKPEELAAEALEARTLREKLEQIENAQSEQKRQDAEIVQFHELFPGIKSEEVPEEIWEKFTQGGSLVESYRQHLFTVQEQTIADLKSKLEIQEQNKANEASAVESFAGKGSAAEKFYTADEISKMSAAEINKNWPDVLKSIQKNKGR